MKTYGNKHCTSLHRLASCRGPWPSSSCVLRFLDDHNDLPDVVHEPPTAASQSDKEDPVPLQHTPYWWGANFMASLGASELEQFVPLPPGFRFGPGSDATGANGPYFCLKAAQAMLQAERPDQSGEALGIDVPFGSEHPGTEGDQCG